MAALSSSLNTEKHALPVYQDSHSQTPPNDRIEHVSKEISFEGGLRVGSLPPSLINPGLTHCTVP